MNKRRWWILGVLILVFAGAIAGALIRWPTQYQITEGPIAAIAFFPDGKTIALGGATQVILWDVATRKERSRLEGHTSRVNAVAYNSIGILLASGSEDQTVRLWDMPGGNLKTVLQGHNGAVGCLAFSPDGKLLASGAQAKPILKLWDVAAGKEKELTFWFEDAKKNKVELVSNGQLQCVAFSPDGNTLAAGIVAVPVVHFDLTTGKGGPFAQDQAESLGFSPDGKVFAAGVSGTTKLWEFPSGKEIASISRGRPILFSPAGNTLALGDGYSDGRPAPLDAGGIKVFAPPHGQRAIWFQSWSSVTALAFSRDGATLVSGGFNGTIMFWEVD